MKTVLLNDQLEIPAIGLGTWKSAPGEVGQAVIEAIRSGYRHIDCAAIYGNEKEIGEALKTVFDQGDVTREELWITSKLWNNAHQKDRVLPALQTTLKDLQLEYLDLYLVHWPVAFKPEVTGAEKAEDYLRPEECPVEETWSAMEEAVAQGLTKSIGVSNFSVKKLNHLLKHSTIKPSMNQVELHPYLSQNDLLEFCAQHHIAITAYSPLGSGDRPKNMKKENEPALLQNETINTIARAHKCTPAQVLIAWHLHRNCVAIPKSTNNTRIEQNAASEHISLTEDDMKAIGDLNIPYRYVDGSFFELEGNGYTNIFDE
ncbi:aldo/keto reductase [Robertkochia sediminum]|uniref:aldo/keto reductase n=1 Tax=Robertkochia sediminum TaxID=2785326 RepID=UPI0019344BB2|nr:aldo/keto reductase [Robertkochia sediminum]MBL7473641.1 aldo/keto reductase [Robertkochia sediminum]